MVSAWDNRFIANVSATYELPRHWSVGAKLSAIGGSPYTPYDEDKSSLAQAWDVQGRPYYDYSRYNAGRLDAFAQLDLRITRTIISVIGDWAYISICKMSPRVRCGSLMC